MLLRSSSTPVLGSLLQSFSESPSHQSELHKHTPTSVHAKISCSNGGSQDFRKSIFHSSPSLAEIKGSRSGFRRVQSDGNLEGLADASYSVDEFSLAKKPGRRNSCCTLEPIPSLSVHRLWTSFKDDSGDDEEGFEEEEEEEYGDYSPVENLVLEQVGSNGNGNGNGSLGLGLQSEGKMYLTAGIGSLGVDFAAGDGNSGGGGGRGSFRPVAFDRDGGDSSGVSMEEHYKRMLEANPGDPLFLRNYAHFLYQIKGDVGAAEEYYSRAILADQEDGETLSQYANIIWEMHRDRERAASYFERAVRVSSQDSHIHAAYAKFLWDVEEDEEEEEEENAASSRVLLQHGFMASATA